MDGREEKSGHAHAIRGKFPTRRRPRRSEPGLRKSYRKDATSMKVKDLLAKLKKCDPEREVLCYRDAEELTVFDIIEAS